MCSTNNFILTNQSTMTNRFNAEQLVPFFQTLAKMQKQGSLILLEKVSYAIGKTFAKAIVILKNYEKERANLFDLFVEFENGEPATVTTEIGKEWKFKEGCKEEFIRKMTALMDQEIELDVHMISEDDLQQSHNLPVDAFTILSEAGMLSELLLPSMRKIDVVH